MAMVSREYVSHKRICGDCIAYHAIFIAIVQFDMYVRWEERKKKKYNWYAMRAVYVI